jgi:hypothetical protein
MSSKLQTSVYPGYEVASGDWHISSAVRIPPNSTIIAVGGQTGGVDWKFGTLGEQLTIIFEVGDYLLKYPMSNLTGPRSRNSTKLCPQLSPKYYLRRFGNVSILLIHTM